MGTLRMEKSGYRRSKLRLRGGVGGGGSGVVIHGMEREFEFEESFTKLADTSGRMRKRVNVENYNPDATRNAQSKVKLLGKYDATENLENVEGGGKKLAMVACSSLGFLLLFAVGSVVCFKKHSKGTLNDAGQVAYCSKTRRNWINASVYIIHLKRNIIDSGTKIRLGRGINYASHHLWFQN